MKKLPLLSFPQLLNDLKPYSVFLFLLIHSVLLIMAWHSEHTVFFVFFAFISIFYYLDYPPEYYNEKVKLYIFSFLAVFFWIYFSINWIKPVNPIAHFILTFLDALVFSIPYFLAYYFRFWIKKSPAKAKIVFISAWVIIELCHDINLLGFPYLNLGHTLAAYPSIIQWYARTGSIGGTIWIMVINLNLYLLILLFTTNGRTRLKKEGFCWPLILVFTVSPIILSFFLNTNSLIKTETTFNAISVHTSSDVYNYKYEVEPDILLENYLTLTLKHIDTTEHNLIVWPENALTGNIFFTKPDSSPIIKKIKRKLCNNPNNILISGAVVDEIVNSPDSNLYFPNILYNKDKQYFFKRYNAALFIRPNASTLIKTKKRLVPFGEKIPPQKIFSPLVSLLPNLANLNFSSRQDEYPVFSIQHNDIRTSPIICYGSAFSDYVAQEVLKTQSNFIVVILNEGWMKSDKAYNHFNWFSICRAIENQRQVIKSSNEGESAIINSSGETEKYVTGSDSGVIESKLYINNNYTFYTKFHSLINYGLLIIGLIFILIQLLIPKVNKMKNRN